MLPDLEDKSSFYKQVNEHLAVSLTHLESDKQVSGSIQLKFHNIGKSKLIINETKPEKNGWLNSIFGHEQVNGVDESSEGSIKLFLSYIQFFGYIVLNYNFDIESGSNPLDLGGNDNFWWDNKDYINHYSNFGSNNEIDEVKIEKLNNKNLFIANGLQSPFVVGGKLGGVDDLVIDLKNHASRILETRKFHLLHDLIYPFNSHPQLNNIESKLKLNDLTEKIIPFYTTSQSLLFTDITIPPNSSKTFNLKCPIPTNLPPSYNHNLTGPVCDNGLISIRYSLNVTVLESEKMIPSTIYFPIAMKAYKHGNDPRWLQKDYFQDFNCIIDQDWKATVIEKHEKSNINGIESIQSLSINSKDNFLHDLDKLIDTDLYNMPNSTSNRRKKSIVSLHEDIPGYIPQLPTHLKTSYQLRVNSNRLCDVILSRPFYHIGEDINYIIDLNPRGSNDVKVTGYVIHLEAQETFHLEKEEPLIHTYRITGSSKTNTFSSSLMNTIDPQKTHSNGFINIPKFISQQSQASKFMNLTYYLVFKFNLLEFLKNESELKENSPIQESSPGSSEFDQIKQYRFNNEGTELKFRLKIVILP